MAVQYHELVIEGPFHVAKAFLDGLRVGKGWEATVLYSRECSVHRASLTERIVEVLGISVNLTHALVPDALRSDVLAAIAAADPELELEVRSDRGIRSAHFEFDYEIFSEHYAKQAAALFETAPEGVTLEGYSPQVSVDPDAVGVEAYAPRHDYVSKAKGIARGSIDCVVELHRRVSAQELIHCSEIHLDLEP